MNYQEREKLSQYLYRCLHQDGNINTFLKKRGIKPPESETVAKMGMCRFILQGNYNKQRKKRAKEKWYELMEVYEAEVRED